MLLGHWYLVQPGLGRGPLGELNRWLAVLWPFEIAVLVWPWCTIVPSRRITGYWVPAFAGTTGDDVRPTR